MKYADLDTLSLNVFDKNNPGDVEFIKKIFFDPSIKKWFSGMHDVLKSEKQDFFGRGYIIKHEDVYVGYVGIGDFNDEEKCFYIRAAVNKDLRGMSYGSRMLSEVTDYAFKNYSNLESIKAKIDIDNIASLKMAGNAGFKLYYSDYYIKENPYLEKNKAR